MYREMEESSDTILITGFGPFGEHSINASWETVSQLPNSINGCKIIKEQIPVVYKYVETRIPQLWKEYNPKLVIHVGVSSYTNKIQIESCANRYGYNREDVANCCPANGQANCESINKTDCIETNLCLKTICDRLNDSKNLPVVVSQNAGRYLCEFIYYTSLNIDKTRTLFIHVPPLNQPFGKDDLANALEQIVKCCLQLIENKAKNQTVTETNASVIYKNGRSAAAL